MDRSAQANRIFLIHAVMTSSGTFHRLALSAFALFTSAAPLAAYDALVTGGDTHYKIPEELRRPYFDDVIGEYDSGLFLRANGQLIPWGGTAYVAFTGMQPVEDVVAFRDSFALLKNGDLVEIGRAYESFPLRPVITGRKVVTFQCAPFGGGIALAEDGSLIAFAQSDIPSQAKFPSSLEAVETFAMTADLEVIAVQRNSEAISFSAQSGDLLYLPEDLDNLQAVAAGTAHFLALRMDGTVVAWTPDGTRPSATLVPNGLKDVVAISAYDNRSYALKRDGSLVVWGSDLDESVLNTLTNVASLEENGVALLPDGRRFSEASGEITGPFYLANVLDVRESVDGATLALRNDGTIVTWGDNSHGEAEVPGNLPKIMQVAPARNHSVVLDESGAVHGWGDNSHGQLDFPSDRGEAVYISASGDLTLITYTDGTVVQLGAYAEGIHPVPSDLKPAVKADTDGTYCLALHQDGTLTAWGTSRRQPPADLTEVQYSGLMGGQGWGMNSQGKLYGWVVEDDPNEFEFDFSIEIELEGIGEIAVGGEWHTPAIVIIDQDGNATEAYIQDYYGFVPTYQLPPIHHASLSYETAYLFFDADSDSDSLRDNWEMAYFGDLSQTAETDFDGDGHSNRFEQLLGLDPTEADSRLRTTVEQGYVVFGPISPDAGLDYQLVSSDAWGDFVL
ncbi:MAG: hypothetical protein Q7P63_10495, partial [Verrucomicrobiota bacterium JB022]|nr:hypothetical protein [Verrucomicrobiota bacterium JB022]